MVRKVYISPVNNIQMVKSGSVTPDKYSTPIDNESWISEQVQSWTDFRPYSQPIQKTDRFTMEIWSNSASQSGCELRLYRCNGTLVNTFSMSAVNLPNIYNGLNTQIFFEQSDFWVDLDEGEYYIYVYIPYSDGSSMQYISERISLSEKWQDTLYIEYKNSTNIDGVLFELASTYFGLRVQGSIIENDQLVDRVTFEDQDDDSIPLFAQTYDNDTLVLGSENSWVPDYMVRKVSHIFDLDAVLVNGVQRVAPNGSSFEKQREDNYNLVTATMKIAYYDNSRQFTWVEGGLIWYATATTFPYVVLQLDLNNGSFNTFGYSVPHYIKDTTGLNDLIDRLNNVVLPNAGLNGTASIEGTALVYSIGIGETLDNADSTVLNKFQIIGNNASGGGIPINLGIIINTPASTGSYYAIIDYNSNIFSSGFLNANTFTSFTASTTSPAGGTFNYLLFHDNSFYKEGFSGDRLISITGDAPSQLNTFAITQSAIITSFNLWASLKAARLSLQTVTIQQNPLLTSITNYYSVTDNLSLIKLKFLYLRLNKLSVSAIDTLYNNIGNLAVNAFPITQFTESFGAMQTSNQSPAAVPTTASAGARSTLTNTYQWILTTTP